MKITFKERPKSNRIRVDMNIREQHDRTKQCSYCQTPGYTKKNMSQHYCIVHFSSLIMLYFISHKLFNVPLKKILNEWFIFLFMINIGLLNIVLYLLSLSCLDFYFFYILYIYLILFCLYFISYMFLVIIFFLPLFIYFCFLFLFYYCCFYFLYLFIFAFFSSHF